MNAEMRFNQGEYEARALNEFKSNILIAKKYLPEIESAYRHAEKAHVDQERLTGERFFEHPRRTALILAVECKIHDPQIIIPTLLHDTVEDTDYWGERPHSAKQEITKEYGAAVAKMVDSLTHPSDKDIQKASPQVILIKLADRLDNIRTLQPFTQEQQVGKIKETEKLLSLIKRVRKKYPYAAGVLERELRKAIDEVVKTWK